MNDPSRLKKLYQLGQSPWYDNIDRRSINDGGLKALFDMGIMGVTSNPSIFEKSINSSSVYDEKIFKLKREGASLEAIYDELTADDVRDAADMLKGVYERTRGVDGYVSIEVLPAYAHDVEKTIAYGRHIFKKVGRPNIMVKVPGTKESPQAIRALLCSGININATLLFSVSQYERIVSAYMDGLRDRSRLGLELTSVASVASVFISRIDTKIDSILDIFADRQQDMGIKQGISSLKGKAAIANTKFVYRRFKELFSDRMFGDLSMQGARVQRPLWASTSTKNPAYSDCLYVDNLIGPLTVNTLPHATVDSFVDHGRLALTLESDMDDAGAHLSRLQELGLDLEIICEEAQNDGLLAFQNSFDKLMDSLKAKVG